MPDTFAAIPGLPFSLPEREAVLRIRKRDAVDLAERGRPRTQAMAGFEEGYTDIVDWILRITEEIWVDRGIGRIYDTYAPSCTIYTQLGVVRSVDEVIASTVASLNAAPDGEPHHLNVAWSGDERDGFYTAHLGFARSTNLGRSDYGPATGLRTSGHFAADCISKDNLIHTEWLVRDNGARVRQMGLDVDRVAQELAERPRRDAYVISPPTRMVGQAPRGALDIPNDTPEGWARTLFHEVWNRRRLDRLAKFYDDEVAVHAGGGRVARGLRNASTLLISMMAAIPDGVMRVEHVCWSEETDGVIVAVRWTLAGTTARGGVLGDNLPVGRPVEMMGMSHLRLDGPKVVEEWTVFDEVAVLARAYAA